MKSKFLVLIAACLLFSCKSESSKTLAIQGTWKLISGSITDKKTGKTSEYPMDFEMIKIINDTHFAFLKHSLNKADTLGFDAGGGSYTLNNDAYVEHLEYYGNKNWEGKTFDFKIILHGDTLIQTGVEQVEKEGIDRVIVERYIKTKP
ncbi:hypothetical protein QWY86_01360 [Pedobacter aquatilis]|uniref:hypothetical protein n=1 Tax=Pedobacter aquatilis TaxID=351343 RepID=UPI0025B4E462|nr:hypothetical protein [Pedobacter aquatilis]MDN3585298.1 hypothetical protein [Pedobacter aquatilis]